MRAMILVAMLATLTGCHHVAVPTRYDAPDATANQCRNECHMQCGRDYLSVCLDECYSECAEFHGGDYYPLGACMLFPPKVERYDKPSGDDDKSFPAPADSQTTPPATPAPTPEVTPAPDAPPAEPTPDAAPQNPPQNPPQ